MIRAVSGATTGTDMVGAAARLNVRGGSAS
jgi:hypothetical protein